MLLFDSVSELMCCVLVLLTVLFHICVCVYINMSAVW